MKRDIYIVHAGGALGVTRVIYDDTTPGDIIICASGSGVDQADQVHIEETNLDPADFQVVHATNAYRMTTIPIDKVGLMRKQTVEEFFRELWGDEVYDTEAMSRDW
jgi:uncharacterized UPF0160 family protein